jgi:hypothetical protein
MNSSVWDDVPQVSIDRVAAQDALQPVTYPCFQYFSPEKVVTWCFSYSPVTHSCFRY